MRASKKDIFIKSAFKSFLLKGYDGLSLSDIEADSGMTRGTIFYYFKNKEDMFHGVIEEFVMGKQDIDRKAIHDKDMSVKGYIESYVGGIRDTMCNIGHLFDANVEPVNISRGYLKMILDAMRMFPDFNNWYRRNIDRDINLWGHMLYRGMESGEIRQDANILVCAKTFTTLYYGQVLCDTTNSGLNYNDLLNQMENFYQMIKKQPTDLQL